MADDADIDDLKPKHICFGCVDEKYLREEIRKDGKRAECSYCQNEAKCYSIDELAERIEQVFEEHYTRTSDQPDSMEYRMLADKESSYEWDREGEPVIDAIAYAAHIPEEAAQDIHSILEDKHGDFEADKMGEETEFAADSYYEEKGVSDARWQEEWRSFERSLKSEARFFSKSAAAHLASIFGDIDQMETTDGRPLVINAGPDTTLTTIYRARVFQSTDKLKVALCHPDQQLGSPSMIDANAGRMNARGISVFYGANKAEVAIAEVRPPVGSEVTVASFDIIRPLKLLDLTALTAVTLRGSIFDPSFSPRLERAMFLRSLSQHITRPVMPDDEAFDYLTTQAIADFLASENKPTLDGILFPSVQAGSDALNVVLFHKAARVEDLDILPGTRVTARTEASTDEGWEPEYSVLEELPPKKTGKPALDFSDADPWGSWTRLEYLDTRPNTLRINAKSIAVHIIKQVSFESEKHHVHRHRWERDDNPGF